MYMRLNSNKYILSFHYYNIKVPSFYEQSFIIVTAATITSISVFSFLSLLLLILLLIHIHVFSYRRHAVIPIPTMLRFMHLPMLVFLAAIFLVARKHFPGHLLHFIGERVFGVGLMGWRLDMVGVFMALHGGHWFGTKAIWNWELLCWLLIQWSYIYK